MQVQAYLHFDGRCEEAIGFYKKALGAELKALMHFKDAPALPNAGCVKPELADKVMHSEVRFGDTTVFMSDCGTKFESFSLSYPVTTQSEARRIFEEISEGGSVIMPLGETFFAEIFGMVKDRFGVSWMVIIPKEGSNSNTRPAEVGEMVHS